ncbi:MAG: GreA/GreB family elongation factor [Alphaproteobacteria bacterium]|nr:GreA/GreB family elongation factor [Alphaproteobacteria bacterium]
MPDKIYVISDYLNAQEKRLDKIRRELQTVSEETSIQGNISWHDNFEYEDGARQERMLIEQMQQLQQDMARYVICDVPNNAAPTKVDIWTRIRILEINLTTGVDAEKEIDIVPLGAEDFKNRKYHYLAPIVAPLMGRSIGDTKTVRLPGGQLEITVLGIETLN